MRSVSRNKQPQSVLLNRLIDYDRWWVVLCVIGALLILSALFNPRFDRNSSGGFESVAHRGCQMSPTSSCARAADSFCSQCGQCHEVPYRTEFKRLPLSPPRHLQLLGRSPGCCSDRESCGGCESNSCCYSSSRSCSLPSKPTYCIAPCVLIPTLRYTWGRGLGNPNSYGTIEQLLFPLRLNNNLWPFLDLRLHALDDGELAANVGAGVRYYSREVKKAFGANVYYDFRETERHLRFSQIGLGFELFSECWDLRLNGYLPIDSRKLDKKCLWTYPGGYFIEKKRYQEARRGGDFEMGVRFGRMKIWGERLGFYGAVGPYYYKGDSRHIVGGRARLRMDMSRYFKVEGIVTRDTFYKTRFQVQVSLTFPLGCCAKNKTWESILSQPIQRNEIIVVDEFNRWRWNY